MTSHRTILVVGAGYSGALVATHLLRSDGPALRVVLVDRQGEVGRGVAYGTASPGHLLNVPAGRMSALPDDDDHFLRFARNTIPAATGGSFLPRRLYGEYVEATLCAATRQAEGMGHRLERLHDEVGTLEVGSERVVARLASGGSIDAAHVVLALGNYPPSDPVPADGDRSFFTTARYVRDPWAPGALDGVDLRGGALLVGTGLTMLDVALHLSERASIAPIYAMSRRGLTPLPHRPHGAPPSYGHLPPGLIACEPSASAYLRAMRRHARVLERAGVDWREVMASLRPVTPRLWETLSAEERRRFLRHARPFWDTHRHRVASEIHDRFESLRTARRLIVLAGRVRRYAASNDEVTIDYRPRGASSDRALRVSTVINCTGPESDVRRIDDHLLASLLAQGTARTDALGLGLDTDDRQALVGGDGAVHTRLWLTGPLLKGRYWESTAVPELRVHAARVARGVLGALL